MSTVLLVEPDRRVRSFIAGILADFGHQVRQSGDAEDAAICLAQVQFDVLATDLVLDLSDLKQPITVLTLSGRRRDPSAKPRERMPRLFDKPFRVADLHRLVRAIGAFPAICALAG